MEQIMKLKQTKSILRNNLQLEPNKKCLKKLQEVENCKINGAVSVMQEDTYNHDVLNGLGTDSTLHVKKHCVSHRFWLT